MMNCEKRNILSVEKILSLPQSLKPMPLHPIASNVIKVFKDNFKEDPLIVRAPGRVNIIGEHTDYNEGFVLPAAIDKSTFVAVGKRNDECMRLIAENFDEIFEANLSAMIPSNIGLLTLWV